MRLPVLNDAAKVQLLFMGLGLASALWVTDKMGLSVPIMLIGAVVTWIAWEGLIGMRMAAAAKGISALAIGALSGFAFPWGGYMIAMLLEALRP